MSRLDLAIVDAAGTRLTLPTSRATGVTFSTGSNGYQDLTAFLPMTDAAAVALSTRAGLRALLWDGPALLWEGRVEDLTLRNGGVELAALGDWRALEDDRYTALWSDSSVKRWEWLDDTIIAGTSGDRYEHDTNNRLYMALQKDATYGNGTDYGIWGYQIPDRSTRNIVSLTFNWLMLLPANWQLLVQARAAGFGTATNITTIVSAGGVTEGTATLTFAGAPSVNLALFNATGSPWTYTGETGALRLVVTNMRVKTTTAAAVTADLIAQDIRNQLNLLNPGTFSASNRRIVSPGIDLTNALWEDASPQDVLAELAAMGDSAGNQFEVGVWEGRTLHFRPVGSEAQAWVVDAAEVEVTQTLDGLTNSTYATYEDANDRTLRTTNQTNATSIARYGRTRRRDVAAKTTSATTAALVAATATRATATPVPRSRVRVRRFATATGAIDSGMRVRAGDTVSIRNLPAAASDVIDRVRTFRVTETSYDADDDTPELTPENPIPDIEQQIAFALRKAGR